MFLENTWELPDMISPERYVLGLYLELIVAIISIIFWALMIKKWLNKKTKLTATMTIAYFGFIVMLLSTLVEKILVTQNLISYPDLVYKYKIGVLSAMGALIFVLSYSFFIYELFLKEKPRAKIALRIYQILCGFILLYGMVFIFIPVSREKFDLLFLPLSAISIILLIPLFLITIISPMRIIAKLPDPETSDEKLQIFSLRNIAINSGILLGFILLFGLDVAIPTLGMSILYIIAWILMGISFIFAYIGYFNPQWVKKYIST